MELTRAITYLSLVCAILDLHLGIGLCQQLIVQATTPSGFQPGQPNTVVALSNQVASSLLGSATPVLLWGVIQASTIREACDAIVLRGTMSFETYIQGSWATNERLTLKVEETGGCDAAGDESGTEFVFTDNYNRRSAVICPSGAGQKGCGVYMTGDDVNELYHRGAILTGTNDTMADNAFVNPIIPMGCSSGAARDGAIVGSITGVTGLTTCANLGPIIGGFCAVGMLGVSAALGAIAGCAKSCFPGDGVVELVTGQFVPMNQLQLGDKVAVLKNGQKAFEDVYAFGHRDKHAMTEFLRIHVMNNVTKSQMALEISHLHFVPSLSRPPHKSTTIIYKRAIDVETGDMLLAFHEGNGFLPHEVITMSPVLKEGLYNPFTLGGNIIVDGVVASAHSDWFLDPLFNRLGMKHLLPPVYQLLLLPVRWIYYALGPQIYMVVYNWLDSTIDIAETGSKYGAEIVIAAATTFFIAVAKPKLANIRSEI